MKHLFNFIFVFVAKALKKIGSSTRRRCCSTGLPEIYAIKVYDNKRYNSLASIIGNLEPGTGIDIDIGNQVSIYATIFILLWLTIRIRQLFNPKIEIQFEVVMVKRDNTIKYCLIDLNDTKGHNLWLYFLFNNKVTRHYITWNDQTWYGIISKPNPLIGPTELSPIIRNHFHLHMIDNDSVDLYAPVTEVGFPGPNMGFYGYLCNNYSVITYNGLHNYQTQVLPMDLVLENISTGNIILPLQLYKWVMKIEEGDIIRDC